MSRLSINPSSIVWGAEHAVGNSFTVEVRLTDVVDCYGLQFGIEWDSNVLSLEEALKGDFLEATGVSTWWFPYSEPGYALCCYMRFEAASGVNVLAPSSGLAATLKFKVLKPMPCSTSLKFRDVDCLWFNSSYEEFTFDHLESASFVFGAPAYPKLVLVNVSAPSQASSGEAFEVNADWRNEGEAGTAYTRLIDLDTGAEILRREFSVDRGETGVLKFTVIMPSKDFRLRLEVGHLMS
ncbi:MAG: cohesin domain-containing protein [Candidatus Bathyarchaeia archaeon]